MLSEARWVNPCLAHGCWNTASPSLIPMPTWAVAFMGKFRLTISQLPYVGHLRVCHIQDCPLWGMLSSGYTQNKNYYISYVSKKKLSCWLNWVMWLGSPLFLGWVGYLPAPGSTVPATDLRGRSQKEWPAVSPRLLVIIASTTPRSLASRIDSILMDIVAYTLLIIFYTQEIL